MLLQFSITLFTLISIIASRSCNSYKPCRFLSQAICDGGSCERCNWWLGRQCNEAYFPGADKSCVGGPKTGYCEFSCSSNDDCKEFNVPCKGGKCTCPSEQDCQNMGPNYRRFETPKVDFDDRCHICGTCTNDSECEGDLVCDLHNCYECKDDSQCTNNPDHTKCYRNKCGCKDAGDCAAPFDICVQNQCKISCTSEAQCTLDRYPGCNSYCRECTRNDHCLTLFPNNKEYCYNDYTCVECLQDSHCKDYSKTKCVNGWCKPCTETTSCLHIPGLTYCLPNQHCVECLSTPECPIFDRSQCVNNQCVACTDNSHCAHIENNRNVCKAGRCEQCEFDHECSGIPGVARCESGNCIECSQDSHCPDSTKSYCDSYKCSKCTQDQHCTHISGKNRCDVQNGICQECTANAQCPSNKPYCYQGTCRECHQNDQCTLPALAQCSTTSYVCQKCSQHTHCSHISNNLNACQPTTQLCVECTEDSHCNFDPLKKKCGQDNKCYGCLQSSDCTQLSKASCVNKECQPCSINSDCFHIANPNTCIDGMCLECTLNSDCNDPTKPICYDFNCAQCSQNSHCSSRLKSQCNFPLKSCEICTQNAHCSHLPSNAHVCLANFGCVQCKTNSDCNYSATENQCKVEDNTCVECLSHENCKEGYFCYQDKCLKCPQYCTKCIIQQDLYNQYESEFVNGAADINSILKCTSCLPGLAISQKSQTFTLPQAQQTAQFQIDRCDDVCGDGIRPDRCITSLDCCDDGNINEGDGCSQTCIKEAGWYCEGGGPQSKDSCTWVLTTEFEQSGSQPQLLTFRFNIELASLEDFKNQLSLEFSNTKPSTYSLEYKLLNNTSIQVFVSSTHSIQGPHVMLRWQNASKAFRKRQIYNRTVDKDFVIQPILLTPQEVLDQAKAISSAINITNQIMLSSSSAFMVFGGDPSPFLRQISIIQSLLLLLFMNVRYPENFEIFLDILKIGTMKMIPNPFTWFFGTQFEETDIITPTKFYSNGFTGSFLKNSGNLLFLFMILGIIHALSKAIDRITSSSQIVRKFTQFMRTKFGFPLMFKFFVSTSTVLLMSLILQLYYWKFDTGFNILSSGFSALVALLFLSSASYIFWAHLKLKKASADKNSTIKYLIKKYELIFQGFVIPSKSSKTLPKPFLAIIFGKRIASVICIVALYEKPLWQVIAQVVLSLAFLVILIKLKPYAIKSEQHIQVTIEVITILIFGLAFSYYVVFDEEPIDYPQLIIAGWVSIALAVLMIVLLQATIFWGMFGKIKSKICKKKKQNDGKTVKTKRPKNAVNKMYSLNFKNDKKRTQKQNQNQNQGDVLEAIQVRTKSSSLKDNVIKDFNINIRNRTNSKQEANGDSKRRSDKLEKQEDLSKKGSNENLINRNKKSNGSKKGSSDGSNNSNEMNIQASEPSNKMLQSQNKGSQKLSKPSINIPDPNQIQRKNTVNTRSRMSSFPNQIKSRKKNRNFTFDD